MKQASIFGSTEESGAVFSEHRHWRYTLWRKWADGPTLAMVACNPSTADESILDPTCAGMVKRAKMWGYGRFVMTNLFGWRATDPRCLRECANPIGNDNDRHLLAECRAADTVIVAWGSCSPLIPKRAAAVEKMLRDADVKLYYLKLGKTGVPCHPLYLPHRLEPQEWL